MKSQSFDLLTENIYICEVIAFLTGFILCKTKLQENFSKTVIKVSSSLTIAKQNAKEKQKTFWLQKYNYLQFSETKSRNQRKCAVKGTFWRTDSSSEKIKNIMCVIDCVCGGVFLVLVSRFFWYEVRVDFVQLQVIPFRMQ